MSEFIKRHIGLSHGEQKQMLADLGYDCLDTFINAVIPAE